MGAPDFLRAYDSDVMAVETGLFLDWYLPDRGIEIAQPARQQWMDMWRALARLSDSAPPVWCCAIFTASTFCGSRTSRASPRRRD